MNIRVSLVAVALCQAFAVLPVFSDESPVLFPIPDKVTSTLLAERETNGVKAVWIDSVPWKGKATKFFAYYGLPEGASSEKKVPGIVLVHGGRGTAFDFWVRTWTARGYAAIAMDTCGGIPGKDRNGGCHPRHEASGPNGWGGIGDESLPIGDQWTYHAVQSVIRSHTFLRNLPEVDATKIGVTGISWGGFLTSIVCGVDPRFAFAAPVYGCGNLRQHSVWSETIGERWDALWDPRHYVKNCRIPTLWCTGSNDHFFPLDSFVATAKAAGNPLFSIKLRMPHGHPPAGDPPEIAAFADSVVKGTGKLTSRKVIRREWLSTDSSDPVWEKRLFVVSPSAPTNATISIRNDVLDDGLILSTPLRL